MDHTEDHPMTDQTPAFVVAGALVRETPGTETLRDLYVAGDAFVSVPPHHAEVIEAKGTNAVPLLVDSALAHRPVSDRGVYDLVPGNTATFALVARTVSEFEVRHMLVVDPTDLTAVYVSGHLEARDGRPTRPAGQDLADESVRAAWAGTWEDTGRDLRQHLGTDGRYSETRGGRANAYTGRFWVRGGRITYLDDTGFWAFGELLDGVLHHAGFVMTRR